MGLIVVGINTGPISRTNLSENNWFGMVQVIQIQNSVGICP
jgi:hypothetical protein